MRESTPHWNQQTEVTLYVLPYSPDKYILIVRQIQANIDPKLGKMLDSRLYRVEGHIVATISLKTS